MPIERIHRAPRYWSNVELRKFAHHFEGSVVNVSAWKDEDKEGGRYKEYFSSCSEYVITNFDADKRGYQGVKGEIFLDLEQPLTASLEGGFDVVFNHTTLEHIYDFRTAFSNLCRMSRDVVIIVVPFVQQMHTDYGDFWRFSPQALDRMFEEEGLRIAHLSFSNDFRSSVYVFCIATKLPDRWKEHFSFTRDYVDHAFCHLNEPYAGSNAIHSNWKTAMRGWLISTFGKSSK